MRSRKRWILLKHVESSSNGSDYHFDLLLEEEHNCRSWRLNKMPEKDGSPLDIIAVSPHDLSWLETEGRYVSGGRGWASPVATGYFLGNLPSEFGSAFRIKLFGDHLSGTLEIKESQCIFRRNGLFDF